MCDLRKITPEAVDEGFSCKCRRAVSNGYNGMKKSGAAECEALEAAVRIYQYHHPEDSVQASRLTVERWVYTGTTHIN